MFFDIIVNHHETQTHFFLHIVTIRYGKSLRSKCVEQWEKNETHNKNSATSTPASEHIYAKIVVFKIEGHSFLCRQMHMRVSPSAAVPF